MFSLNRLLIIDIKLIITYKGLKKIKNSAIIRHNYDFGVIKKFHSF